MQFTRLCMALVLIVSNTLVSKKPTPLIEVPEELPGPVQAFAKVIDVYDGDTCTVIVRIWGEGKQSLFATESIRLYGIDTPEIKTTDLAEKERGYAAKQFTSDRILKKTVRLDLVEREKFGRLMATVFYKDANDNWINLNQELVDNGHAKEYFGGARVSDDEPISLDDENPYDRND